MTTMKILTLAITYFLFASGNGNFGGHKLKLAAAERIMGETCILKEDSARQLNGGHEYKMTFLTKASQANTDRPNALYYLFTSYRDEKSAKDRFNDVFESNKNHQGFEKLQHLGDEALFHSDDANFMLIMARQKNEIVAIKVNKISKKSSIEELKKVTEELIKSI